MIAQIKQALHIQTGEGHMVLLFVAHSFFNGITIGFMGAAVSALFLTRYTASDLPLVYIVATVITFITGLVYHPLSHRLPLRRLLVVNRTYTFVLLLLFTIAFLAINAPFPALMLAAIFDLIWVMNSLGFWGLAGKILDVRQAKRLYGLLGAGEVLAIILSGFVIPFIVPIIRTEGLLFIAMAGVALSFAMMWYITHRYAVFLIQPDVVLVADKPDVEMPITQGRYIFLIFVLVSLAVSTLYVVDTAFYQQVEVLYPDENELASFLGIFFSVAGILQLASRMVITGRLLSRYGVMMGLIVFPALLILFGVAVLIGVGIGEALIVAWAVILMKWVDRGLRYTLNQSTILVLYQPLPTHQRVPVQTRVESNVEAVAGFAIGTLLLILTSQFNFGTLELVILTLVICVLWIGIVLLIRKPYVMTLVQTLTFERINNPVHPTTSTETMPVIDDILTAQDVDVEQVQQTIITHAQTALAQLEKGAISDLHITKTRILRLVALLVHPSELVYE
ncbi:MAG: hypothetical protein CUN52_09605, partial [Phototrophicales bacterium]